MNYQSLRTYKTEQSSKEEAKVEKTKSFMVKPSTY